MAFVKKLFGENLGKPSVEKKCAARNVWTAETEGRYERKSIMNRREVLGVVGAAAIGLGAVGTAGAQEKPKVGPADKAAAACADCLVECSKCMRHCVTQLAAGKKEYAKCAELCGDCMECCACAAKCCHGPLAHIVCEACAKCCEACAAECEKIASDEVLKACAKSCRDCAKACHAMMKH